MQFDFAAEVGQFMRQALRHFRRKILRRLAEKLRQGLFNGFGEKMLLHVGQQRRQVIFVFGEAESMRAGTLKMYTLYVFFDLAVIHMTGDMPY